jgi:hypothetical protein
MILEGAFEETFGTEFGIEFLKKPLEEALLRGSLKRHFAEAFSCGRSGFLKSCLDEVW